MFDLDQSRFPVRIHRDVTEEDDQLWLRFRFQQSLMTWQKDQFEDVLQTWFEAAFDAELVNYLDDDIRWYTKSTLAVVYLDTGGNDLALAPYLDDLLHEVNDIAALKEVRLTAD